MKTGGLGRPFLSRAQNSTPGERDAATFFRDMDRVSRREFSGEDFLRQRILDLLLDGTLEGPRTVDRIETGLRNSQGRAYADLISSLASRASRFAMDLRDQAMFSPTARKQTISSMGSRTRRNCVLTSASTASSHP
jgi:hypothetical protein